MKKKKYSSLLLVCYVATLVNVSCTSHNDFYPTGAITDFRELRKEFSNPSPEYRTIPFFVWNGKITKPDIDSFMVSFKDAGFGGVFIHARPGLITSYLTDEWFDLFRYTVNKGRELGIKVWIYDEYNFPSGFA